jgi:hypothetical protein
MREPEHVVHIGKMRNPCKILFGKFEGKRLLGRPRLRWQHGRMLLKWMLKKCYEGADWIQQI